MIYTQSGEQMIERAAQAVAALQKRIIHITTNGGIHIRRRQIIKIATGYNGLWALRNNAMNGICLIAAFGIVVIKFPDQFA